MVKMIPLVCPKCGAQLEIKAGMEVCYCAYCGTQIKVTTTSDSVDNRRDSHDNYYSYDNSTHTTINKRGSVIGDIFDYFEQKEKEKKEEEERQKRELERQERLAKERAERRKAEFKEQLWGKEHRNRNKVILFILCICVLIGILISTIRKLTYIEPDHTGQAQIPKSAYSFEEKNYKDAQILFQKSGFTNITLEPEGDLITGWITKDGSIDSISVDGDDNFQSGTWCPADAEVVIRYHSFSSEPISENDSDANENSAEKATSSMFVPDPDAEIPEAPKGDINGFNETTNIAVDVDGLTFYIPSYYTVWEEETTEDQMGFYVKGDDPCGILFTYGDCDLAEIAKVSSEKMEARIDESFHKAVDEILLKKDSSCRVVDFQRQQVLGMSGRRLTFEGDGYYGRIVGLVNTELNRIYVVLISVDDIVQYDYLPDFDRIVNSVVYSDAVDKSENNSVEDSNDTDSGFEIPVLKGSNVDIAVKKAAEYGLVENYEDDFGHGTKCKSLSDDSGGLMLSLIYSTETDELLCGSIVTINLVTSDQQKNFIQGMAGVLCPEGDAKDVTAWVNSNVGTEKQTTIEGIDYKTALGPTQNAFYYAGYDRWEEWDLQFQK